MMEIKMDYPWAVVGASVICVNPWVNTYGVTGDQSKIKGPELNEVVTIRNIVPSADGLSISLRFNEYKNPLVLFKNKPVPWEQGFHVSRFKPLEKKKLPDVLTSILINPKKKIEKDQFDLVLT
jgi:hypothetical protein